ncbi:MAG: hypothetical protein K0Q72_3860 [Armatimonadetes bacterium]|jgi:hypothetical protein|nr:hypothetical protein [Armatimonadota bacterium]
MPEPSRRSPFDYVAPICAVLLVVLGAWWFYAVLKQRSRGKLLAPPGGELQLHVPPGSFGNSPTAPPRPRQKPTP